MFLNKSLRWFYNKGHHDKVPMNDVGRTIKNVIFQKVKLGEIIVHTPKEFSDAAMKFVLSVITVYLPKSDVIEFFKTVVDQEALYTQCYKKASDTVCGHENSNKSNGKCSTYGESYTEDVSE